MNNLLYGTAVRTNKEQGKVEILNSLPLQVPRYLTRWFTVSEGGTREKHPRIASFSRATVTGFAGLDIVVKQKKR